MKILHVITSLRTGGAEKLMVDLLQRLRRKGDEVDLLLFDGTPTPFLRQLEDLGIRIFSLSIGENVYNPLNIIRLRHFLHKYDIVHTHNTACQLFVPLARLIARSKPLLFTTEHNTTNRRRGKWYLRPIDCWMYGQYSRIIAISEKAAELLAQHIGRNDISVIENGIDVQRYAQATPIDRHEIVPDYHDGDIIITMVAGFRPQKDQDSAIRALTHLPNNYKLCLVGDGERRNIIEALIVELGLQQRVMLLGIRSDVPDILSASDVVVLASHWEGFGLAAVEGMATKKPLIATNVDGLAQVISGAGVLFADGDHHQLATAIAELMNHPDYYQKVATACAKAALRYDIATTATRYSNLYHLAKETQTTV